MMIYKIAQVIGLNTDQKAAQVLSSIRDKNNLFLAVLQLTSDDAFTRGRQILNELLDFYFEGSGNVGTRLTQTYEEFKKKLDAIESYDVCLAAVSGKALYIIYEGEVAVYLKRGVSVNSLISVGSPSQIISGFLTEGDRVFLASHSLTALLGEDLRSSLQIPFESWEDEINNRINTQGVEHQGMAGLILEVIPENAQDFEHQVDLSDSYKEQIDLIPTKELFQIFSRLTNFFKREKQDNEPLWEIRQGRSKKAVVKLLLGLSLIIILSLGIGFQYKKNKDAKTSQQFTLAIDSTRNDLAAAQSLKTINPQEARQKLDSAFSNLDKALKLKPDDKDAKDLQNNLNQAKDEILQQFSASDINLFLDLNLIKDNFRVEKLSVSGGKLLLLDPSSSSLVLVELDKKSQQILAGKDDLGEARLASLNGDFAFLYSSKGILKMDVVNQKLTTIVKTDADWGEIIDVYGFASNVYLLDRGKNQIWKYLPISSGYSEKREYLLKSADLKDIFRMQIESSIYLMKKGGEILRFTKGNADFFSLSGLDKGILDPKNFFVSSDTDNLYILDSGNSRLVVVDKKGVYKSQYQGDKFASASDLVVDEKGKKVYLLEGSKIYSVDLK